MSSSLPDSLCFPGLHYCQLFAQSPSSVTVELGGSVTLSCSVSKSYSSNVLIWNKQPSGGPSTSIVSFKNHESPLLGGDNKNKSFTIDRKGDSLNLKISNIEASDVARYYCGAIRDTSVRFGSGTSIRLKGSGSVSRRVEQQPASVPVQPGDSVTLQCTIHTETFAGEHSVHWFRHGSGEALPGLIYTHGNRSDPCESSSEPGLPAQGCVYELPKRNLRSSDAGTYYCAVATCGPILFGNGTWLDIAGKKRYILC
ncbi:KVD12 protein, partial [Amia calva]|nr:KVD12 protein [Amia calva]